MAERARQQARIEFTRGETILAIMFVIGTLIAIAAAASGAFNPIPVAIVIITMSVLIMAGHYLAGKGILTHEGVLLWYIFSFGVVLLIYGLISKGVLPVVSWTGNVIVDELTTAILYAAIIAVAVVAGVGIGLYTAKLIKSRKAKAAAM